MLAESWSSLSSRYDPWSYADILFPTANESRGTTLECSDPLRGFSGTTSSAKDFDVTDSATSIPVVVRALGGGIGDGRAAASLSTPSLRLFLLSGYR